MRLIVALIFCLGALHAQILRATSCGQLLSGTWNGLTVGSTLPSEGIVKGIGLVKDAEREGWSKLVVKLKGGELGIKIDSIKSVRRLEFVARSRTGIGLCPGVVLGRSSFVEIASALQLKPEIRDPVWAESEQVFYQERYQNWFRKLDFVRWSDCSHQGPECEVQAMSRTVAPPFLLIE